MNSGRIVGTLGREQLGASGWVSATDYGPTTPGDGSGKGFHTEITEDTETEGHVRFREAIASLVLPSVFSVNSV